MRVKSLLDRIRQIYRLEQMASNRNGVRPFTGLATDPYQREVNRTFSKIKAKRNDLLRFSGSDEMDRLVPGARCLERPVWTYNQPTSAQCIEAINKLDKMIRLDPTSYIDNEDKVIKEYANKLIQGD